MSPESREELAQIIRQDLERVKEQIASLYEKSAPIVPDCSLGRLTRMEAMGEKAVNERILEESRLRLLRLENAFRRLDREDFGICIECEEPIAFERLKLRPESLRCIDCAQKAQR